MLETVPVSLKEANAFVEALHRHHGPVVRDKFRVGVSEGGCWWAWPRWEDP